MELKDEVYNALIKYFSALSHLGYKSYKLVDNLLVMIFIEELLGGPMAQYITEKDYRAIMEVLYNIYGKSCLIPYPDYKVSIQNALTSLFDKYRLTEGSMFRLTEDSNIRTLS